MSQDRVNNLLHTLRGEQFRHSQNLRRSRTHISSSLAYTHNARTLPQGLIYPPHASSVDAEDVDLAACSPPANWDSPQWRAHALSLIYGHLPTNSTRPFPDPDKVPPLTLLCLRVLHASYPAPDFAEDSLRFVPPHLRRDLLRDTSIHSPLASPGSLCQPDGHADGELIVVGPNASLHGDYFKQFAVSRAENEREGDGEELTWDSHDESTPLHTLVILSVSIHSATLLTFPPTITHLALINLPAAVPLHRCICPLLTVLDLSYNKWLGPARAEGPLEGLVWSRWSRLEVLGLRGCWVSGELHRIVNKGRWNDVKIIT